MIQTIKKNRKLANYTGHQLEDAGIEVEVDKSLSQEEYIGIKVDNYYMGLRLGGETPKAVDFIVAVDCQCNSYVLYILEFKNVSSPRGYTTKEIWEKFDTAIECRNYQDYIRILGKINQRDTLVNDQSLATKKFVFRNRILAIEREIPPNPVIRRIL